MNPLRRVVLWLAPVLALSAAVPAAHAGPGIVDEQVDGNVLEARVVIAGLELADLRIEFEDVTGLEPGALGLSARLLNPLELLFVLLRLPDAVLTTIPVELPLLITVNPGPGFEMRGVAEVSLHTELLPYALGTPLRLFGSPINGTFEDMTAWTDAGSYRAGARRPSFLTQQYVVAADLRQDEAVAESKLDVLDLVLAQRAGVIDPAVLADLTARATAVRGAFEGGDHGGAIAELDAFEAAVVAESGEGIPDVWQRSGNAANAAGELRSQAATLRYTLVRIDQGL